MATTDEDKKKYELDTSYYDNAISDYNSYVDKSTASQIASAESSAKDQLRQAYIKKLQDQQTLKNNLAAAGIRGGVTETANLKLATDYGTSRNTINSDLSSSISSINSTAEANKLSYAQEMQLAKQQATENYNAEMREAEREEAATEAANAREDQLRAEDNAREDQLRAEDNAREDAEKEQEELEKKYTALYAKYYKIDKLKALRKKATTALQKRIIDARIAYLREHKKGY